MNVREFRLIICNITRSASELLIRPSEVVRGEGGKDEFPYENFRNEIDAPKVYRMPTQL